jgi:uncharacterized protein YbjQ (UPF0145 family)
MPFWKKETEQEKLAKQRQEATIAALNNGDIPLIARERLELQRKYGTNFFTSDLTAKEYMLTREAGYKTLGQVMGTSFFRVGLFGTTRMTLRGYTGELSQVTQAHIDARRFAVNRMITEAKILGASGVIAVRIQSNNHAFADGVVEFTAFGTAVVVDGYPADAEPFASALTGQEFWLLHEAGYWPCGLAMGMCSYYVATNYSNQSLVNWRNNWWGQFSNQEIEQYTQAIYTARHLAQNRLQQDLRTFNAEGAVGMTVKCDLRDVEYESNDTTYHDLLIEFVAIGTAVRAGNHQLTELKPLVMYDLAKKSYRNLDYQMSWDSPDDLDFDDED